MPNRTVLAVCNFADADDIFSYVDFIHEIIVYHMYNKSMKRIKIGHTVSFVMNDITLYGIVEKIVMCEDGPLYMIYANRKLYKNVPGNLILQDYGDFEDA